MPFVLLQVGKPKSPQKQRKRRTTEEEAEPAKKRRKGSVPGNLLLFAILGHQISLLPIILFAVEQNGAVFVLYAAAVHTAATTSSGSSAVRRYDWLV